MLNHNQQISENFEQAPGSVGYGVAIGPVLSQVQASLRPLTFYLYIFTPLF